MDSNLRGVTYAFAASVLFGLSTPLAKRFLGAVDPWMLAALFYLGSGLGLGVLLFVRSRGSAAVEAPLRKADLPWLAGAIFSGGVVAPVLMMTGLAFTAASAASLLLTVEGVATALIAWFAFKENFDRRIALGMMLIVAGAAVLSWQDNLTIETFVGPIAIAGACVAWGVDNNLTRKVALADPIESAMLKGLAAGSINLLLALIGGAAFPPIETGLLAGVVGLFGYGFSLVLFILALRDLGTARTGAYFSTAPFIGALAAIPIAGDALTLQLTLAGLLMGVGVWLHLTERHEHEHEHEPLEHTHRHVHDEHHRHAHVAEDPAGEPHSHRHVHIRLRHTHRHVPDSHHRHSH